MSAPEAGATPCPIYGAVVIAPWAAQRSERKLMVLQCPHCSGHDLGSDATLGLVCTSPEHPEPTAYPCLEARTHEWEMLVSAAGWVPQGSGWARDLDRLPGGAATALDADPAPAKKAPDQRAAAKKPAAKKPAAATEKLSAKKSSPRKAASQKAALKRTQSPKSSAAAQA